MPIKNSLHKCIYCGELFDPIGRMESCWQCRVTRVFLGKKLSKREEQVVQLIKQGKTNKQIAAELDLTCGTIKSYLAHIFSKLGVKNRFELAVRSLKQDAT